jgi:hypothetical protein
MCWRARVEPTAYRRRFITPPNIALPTNHTPTVTVTFNQTAGFPDVRIFEYSGLSPINPLDNWAGATGVSVLANSGGVTTTGASDLILGGGTTGGSFTLPGVGFTSRGITSAFGDIVEDLNAGQPAGTYNATAALLAGSTWVMQVAGFSTTGVIFPQSPTISPTTPITPASGPDIGGTAVTISGTNFQPGAIVLFGTAPGGISGVNCIESGGTTIQCLTPADSAGVKDVTVVNVDGGLSSAAGAYTDLNVPDFTIAAAALSPAMVSAGASATSAITVAPLNGFTSAVNLTCAVTPAATKAPTCSLSPSSVAGGSGPSMLTVSTTAATTGSLAPQSRGVFYAMWLPIGGLALLGTGFTSRKKKFWSFLFGCLIFSGLIFLGACGGSSSSGGGGGNSGTPAGTYTVAVTGTSGSLTHSQSLSLVVQ